MDDLCVRGEDPAQFGENLGRHVSAAHQVDIAFGGDGQAGGAEHMTGLALVERMRIAEIEFTRVDAPHFGAEQFSHPGSFGLGAGISHAVADEKHRFFGAGQPGSGLLKKRLVGEDAGGGDGSGVDFLYRWGVQDVGGQADVDRSHGGCAGDLDGAPHGAQQGSWIGDHGGPLGDRFGEADQVSVHLGFHGNIFEASIAADDYQGGMAAHGLVKGADGVAEARGAVDLHEGGFLCGTRIAVTHHQGNGFMQGKNVLHLWVGSQRIQKPLFDGARIPKHDIHPVGEKLLNDSKTPCFYGHVQPLLIVIRHAEGDLLQAAPRPVP